MSNCFHFSNFLFFISPGLFHPYYFPVIPFLCRSGSDLMSAYHPCPMSKENRNGKNRTQDATCMLGVDFMQQMMQVMAAEMGMVMVTL